MTPCLLHISDLHRDLTNPISNGILLDSLERDRDQYTAREDPLISEPNIIVVSGDIVQGVKHSEPSAESNLRKQYHEALDFLNSLTLRFARGDKDRVIIVPGNHDVNDCRFRNSLEPVNIETMPKKKLVEELFTPESSLRWSWEEFSLFKISDIDEYNARFSAFAEFYTNFYEGTRTYSIEPGDQLDIFDFPKDDFTIIGFSSCYNNDLLNKPADIHADCIAKAGEYFRHLPIDRNPLRIAVWHHSTQGPPTQNDYMDPDIVQNLISGGFSLAFHGHQHRPEFIHTRFRHGPDRKITVISAGTLCGGPDFRFGRAYNVVELHLPNRTGCLHPREMQNHNLTKPIWGARSIPPSRTSFQDFEYDPPPQRLITSKRNTVRLSQVQAMYDEGKYQAAADHLLPIVNTDPLAKRLFLQCLVELDDSTTIVRTFDPPKSAAETIALMDALWETNDRTRLALLLTSDLIESTTDPSIVEVRTKYSTRLRR